MDLLTVVRCPNCGSFAHRLLSDRLPFCHRCPDHQVAKTECPVCDYLMLMCWQDGKVLEAYAPGRPAGIPAITMYQPPSSSEQPFTVKQLLTLTPQSVTA
ncbi:MAG TPA: hypothetical protein V6C46_08300 [Coleofasciculaceae cyanobacterium]